MQDDEAFEDQRDLLRKLKTRQAIAERRVKGIKFVFGAQKSDAVKSGLKGMRHEVVEKSEELSQEEQEMSIVMGFAKFGHQKPADKKKPEASSARSVAEPAGSSLPRSRQFDIESLVQQTIQNARQSGPAKPSEDDGEEEKTAEEAVRSVDEEEESDDDFIGPAPPPDFSVPETSEHVDKKNGSDSEYSEDESSDEAADRYARLPIECNVTLKHGSKSISALAVDSNGSRLVSGSYDYEVRFWDFERMDHNLNSFRSVTPCECHPINHLSFSSSGDRILVVAGNTQAKILDRDGFVKVTTVKGDQYIRDMANTKGHTAILNSGCWHPHEKEQFITCSNDGTVRIWNLNEASKKQTHVIKTRSPTGLRCIPNSLTTGMDGHMLVAGCSDGSIQGWDLRRKMFVNTSLSLRDCHSPGSDVSSVSFSYLGQLLASRATDDTMKLWDYRNTKTAVASFDSLNNRFAMTECCFSPNDKLLMTGTSCSKGGSDGEVAVFDCATMKKQSSIPFSASVIRCQWHPRLNQLFISSSDGNVTVYYDERLSDKGALLCVGKVRKKEKEAFVLNKPQIITPHALPMFKEERKKSRKVQQMKDRADPVKSRRPELPMSGHGAGGRLANSGSTYASYIARNIATRNKLDDSMDPREAILRHAAEAAANPYWVDVAYKETQPKPIFQKEDEGSESDEDEPKKKRPC